MSWVHALVANLLLCVGSIAVAEGPDNWRPLLDEDLSQWEVFLGVPHKSVEVPGVPPSTSEDGVRGEPLGLGDPLQVFRVSKIDGEPVLHVSGQVYGGLTTLEEFGDFHLTWQFRWGEKKWPPRLHMKRDSGVLFHCVGRHGAFWNVWMRGLECQVQEGDCGDFIPLAGARASVPLAPRAVDGPLRYERGGALETNVNYVLHGPSNESPPGEWTTMDVYAVGDRAVFAVNGVANMAIFDARQATPDGARPLTRGKLQIQSEAAEIDYRRVRVRPLVGFPADVAPHATRPAPD